MNSELMKEMLVEVMVQEFYNEQFSNRKNHNKAPMVFWSGAAIGKTTAVNNAGIEVGALVANVRLSQISVEDLYIPEVTQVAAKRVYKKVLSDLVPTYRYDANGKKIKAKYAVMENGQWQVRQFEDQYQIDFDLLQGYITETSYEAGVKFAQERGLEIYDLPLVYFLDELNRFTSKPLGQAFFEWLESDAFLGHHTPKRIMKIAACNPGKTGDDDVKYQVNDFFKDYAAHSRALHFKVEADYSAILNYMAQPNSGYLPEEIKFYETYPEELEQAIVKLNAFEIPRTLVESRKIKYASNYLFHLQWKNQDAKLAMAEAIYGNSMKEKFFKFMESGASRISTEDLLYRYDEYVLGAQPFIEQFANGIKVVKPGPTLLNSLNDKVTNNSTRKAILEMVERGENEELSSYVDAIINAIKKMDKITFETYFKDNQLKLSRFVADINVALREKLFINIPNEFIDSINELNTGFLEVLNAVKNAPAENLEVGLNSMEVVVEKSTPKTEANVQVITPSIETVQTIAVPVTQPIEQVKVAEPVMPTIQVTKSIAEQNVQVIVPTNEENQVTTPVIEPIVQQAQVTEEVMAMTEPPVEDLNRPVGEPPVEEADLFSGYYDVEPNPTTQQKVVPTQVGRNAAIEPGAIQPVQVNVPTVEPVNTTAPVIEPVIIPNVNGTTPVVETNQSVQTAPVIETVTIPNVNGTTPVVETIQPVQTTPVIETVTIPNVNGTTPVVETIQPVQTTPVIKPVTIPNVNGTTPVVETIQPVQTVPVVEPVMPVQNTQVTPSVTPIKTEGKKNEPIVTENQIIIPMEDDQEELF